MLNALWSPLCLGAELYWVAFVDICVLWLAIIATVGLFKLCHRRAVWLMVPYLLRTTYAAAFNLAIALKN